MGSDARAYLDYNASAPLLAEAREACVAALELVGNPSSVHGEGRAARDVIERAREDVARLVGARPSEVVFTSGATEANATAMSAGWGTIFSSGLEHASIVEPAAASGARVIDLGVHASGVARVETVAERVLTAALDDGPALVALQLANNETGVLQPVAETAAFARAHGLFIHCDAVQGVGRATVDFHALGLDTMSLSAHKIGGPKGVGALVVREGLDIRPLLLGGGQERRRRAGTENIAAIAGFGAAARVVRRDLAGGCMDRIGLLRDRLEREARRIAPHAVVIGADAKRLANTCCIALPGQAAETIVIRLDLDGVAVSAGAACSSGKVGASRVIAAMGLGDGIERSVIRVSIGRETSDADVDAFLAAWTRIAQDVRRAA